MTRLTSLLLSLLLITPALAQEATQPQVTAKQLAELKRDVWFGVYMKGKKSGYAHMSWKPSGTADDPTFTSSMQMELALVAMGQKQRITATGSEVFDGKPPYALRKATKIQVQGQKSQTIVATRKGKVFSLAITSAGQTRTLERPAPAYTVLEETRIPFFFKRLRAAGATLSYKTFSVDRWELNDETLTITERQSKVLDGVKTNVYAVKLKSSRRGDMGTGLVDARGEYLRMDLMGFMEMRREPQKLAKQIEYSADLFVQNMIRIKTKLGNPKTLKRLELKVTGPGRTVLEAGSYQTVKAEGETTRLVVDLLKGTPTAATAEETAKALKETTDFPITHASVVALAKQAVGDATTPAQKVERLVHFVSKYVRDAYGQNAVTALEVIKAKIGDCTEHALLFTTLARAAGIPTRSVAGLMYMGDEVGVFGGHAWNEVVLDGKWIPVDPTWDEVRADAAHVRTDDGQGKNNSIRILGKVKFEVVSVGR